MVAYREHQIREEQLAGNYQEWLKRPVDSEERAEIERIATALEARHAAFERSQPERSLPFIELTVEKLQVQVNVRSDSTNPPSTSRVALSIERKPNGVPSDA